MAKKFSLEAQQDLFEAILEDSYADMKAAIKAGARFDVDEAGVQVHWQPGSPLIPEQERSAAMSLLLGTLEGDADDECALAKLLDKPLQPIDWASAVGGVMEPSNVPELFRAQSLKIFNLVVEHWPSSLGDLGGAAMSPSAVGLLNEVSSSNDRNDFYKLKTLLAHGCDPNAQYLGGKAPLHVASYAPTVKLLLEHDADLTLEDDQGKTPIDIQMDIMEKEVVAAAKSSVVPMVKVSRVAVLKMLLDARPLIEHSNGKAIGDRLEKILKQAGTHWNVSKQDLLALETHASVFRRDCLDEKTKEASPEAAKSHPRL